MAALRRSAGHKLLVVVRVEGQLAGLLGVVHVLEVGAVELQAWGVGWG